MTFSCTWPGEGFALRPVQAGAILSLLFGSRMDQEERTGTLTGNARNRSLEPHYTASAFLHRRARFQSVLLKDRCRGGRGDELDQRLGCVRLLRAGVDACGEHRHPLQVARQRADVVDAGE